MHSGRDRATLSSWFGNSNIGLAAESGYYMKMDSQSDWTVMGMDADESWTGVVRPIMKVYSFFYTEKLSVFIYQNKSSTLKTELLVVLLKRRKLRLVGIIVMRMLSLEICRRVIYKFI